MRFGDGKVELLNPEQNGTIVITCLTGLADYVRSEV
jgi:hypothetical protein